MSTGMDWTVRVLVSSVFVCGIAAQAGAQLKAEKVFSYEAARTIGTTAVEACQAKGYRVSATVVDKDGVTLVQLRGDDASPHTMENSRRNYTPNTFRTDTAVYAKRLNDGDAVVRQQVTLPGVIALAGGLPVKVVKRLSAAPPFRVRPAAMIRSACRRDSTRRKTC